MKVRVRRLFVVFACFLGAGVIAAEPVGKDNTVGRITLYEGRARLSSFLTGERFAIEACTRIRFGHRIRTGRDTVIRMTMNDGSKLAIMESSSINFYYLRSRTTEPPTKMKLDFGKIRYDQKKNFTDKTLEILTPAAEISAVMADLSLVSVDNYSLMLVHSGRVGVASTNRKIEQALVCTGGDEILVPRGGPPIYLGKVSLPHRNSWISSYQIVDRFRRIVSKSDGTEVVDRIDKIYKEAPR